jgi:two-component system cell cycle sensor histidine kinase/response regulator CckA
VNHPAIQQAIQYLQANTALPPGQMLVDSVGGFILRGRTHDNVLFFQLEECDEVQQLKQRVASLEAEISSLGDLVTLGYLAGAAAHDLNNLLQAATLYALLLQPGADEASRADLASLRAAISRASRLIGRVRAVVRNGGVDSDGSFNEVLARSLDWLQPLLGSSIRLDVNLEHNLWETGLSAASGEHIVFNLMCNARAAMPDGGQISVSTENICLDQPASGWTGQIPAGNWVRLQVRDAGRGIPARALTPMVGARGHGLGFSLVQFLVTGAGGHIQIDNRPGEGATVVVLLPALTT